MDQFLPKAGIAKRYHVARKKKERLEMLYVDTNHDQEDSCSTLSGTVNSGLINKNVPTGLLSASTRKLKNSVDHCESETALGRKGRNEV